LAERLRAGGVGIPAFFTVIGAGTQVAESGLPWRYAPDGTVAVASPAKQTQDFDVDGVTKTFVLEQAIRPDFGLVRAAKGDRHGNLVFHESARNFNPLCAIAGKGDRRGGGSAGRARAAAPGRGAPAGVLRAPGAAAEPGAGRDQADRAADRAAPSHRCDHDREPGGLSDGTVA